MKRLACLSVLGAALAAGSLAACSPAGQKAPAGQTPAANQTPAAQASSGAPAAAAGGCPAHAQAKWEAKPGLRFTIDADTLGPSCEQAVLVMVIRDAAGKPVFQWTGATEFIILLNEIKDPAAMPAGVKDFVDGAEMTTTASLTEWKPGEDSPTRGDFPFMPGDGIDRKTYAELRAKALPMFCFAQGLESENCLALEDDMFQPIGFQLLPG